MAFFRKKARPRRVEARRPAAPGEPTRWQRFRAAGGVGSLLVTVAFYAAVLALDAMPLEPVSYRLRQYVPRDIRARVDFHEPSSEETEKKRAVAAQMAPAVIRLDEQRLQKIVGDIQNLPGKLRIATRPADLDQQLRQAFALKTPGDLADFAGLAAPDRAKVYNDQAAKLGQYLTTRFVVSGDAYSKAFSGKLSRKVYVYAGPTHGPDEKSQLLNVKDTADLEGFLAKSAAHFDATVRDNITHYLKRAFDDGAPIFQLDAEATAAVELEARKAVPRQTRLWEAGEVLVRHSKSPQLGREQWLLLRREHDAFVEQRAAERPWRQAKLLAGRAGLLGAVIALLCLYVLKYRPRIVQNTLRAFSVAALMVGMLLLSKLTVHTGELNPYVSVFGIFTAAVILAIVYDQRFAFAVTGALVVLTALQLRMGLGELLVLWAAAAAAAFQLREVRTRSKLIEAGGVTAVVMLGAVAAVEAAASTPVRHMLWPACWAAGLALAAGFLAQGVLPLVERLFGIATSLTLLEWCDANKPLLKRLALEAAGTYSHSLMLGSMCETAAEGIGARGLLARVGAYYHDVGKINKPAYFRENQSGPTSPHDRLNPAMSLLVIKGHVKDGLELAREYGLPRELHQFITSHHGTTLVEYFYHTAAERSKLGDEPAPDEVEFRYPGPRPRSKEAAILMLADASESSVRATPEPTPGRIETQVHQIVSKRLTDGQLDDCDLTLREVHGIERSLVKSLASIHHGRVQYPSQKRGDQAENGPPVTSDT